jgi:SRSO17 transposase
MVGSELGEADGVLMFDESGFVKEGEYSVGVGRQYCGDIGKVEKCQVGVFVGYASRRGYTLVDNRLYFPQPWFEEDHKEKREKCQVPEELEFKTKPQLAAEMLQEIYQEKVLPFKYIGADTVYGNSVDFIEAAERCVGKTYKVSMPADTLCWLKPVLTASKTYSYKGEQRVKKVLKEPETLPGSFEEFARQLDSHFWYKRTVSEGTKGPIEYEFARRQVVLAKDGLPWKKLWLVIKRSVGVNPTYSYYVSNASTSPRLALFVWLSGVRWAIEQCLEEANQEVGMNQYEVRKYSGWHHHMFLCFLAQFFLWHLKLRLGGKKSLFDGVPSQNAAKNGAPFEEVFNARDDRGGSVDSTQESSGLSFSPKEKTARRCT